VKERDVNFFRPLWRRVVVTAVCAVWAGLEILHGEQVWILITLGLTAYAVWNFFIAFEKSPPKSAQIEAPPAPIETADVPDSDPETGENRDVPPQS
jgi:hypothetical protein